MTPPPAEPGDSGFDAFFRFHYTRLCQAVALLTGTHADAEELAQEAFVRVFERWDRVASMDSPDGYLYRTALNVTRKRMRALAVRRRKDVPAPTPGDPLGEVDDRVAVMTMLRELPAAQREAVVLVDWLGLDAETAGVLLGIEPGSVRTRLHRARTTLRERFGGDDA
ncbi:MAG TPA: SigE family RNA polymerase sigma factor [Actinomycetota bacterium]